MSILFADDINIFITGDIKLIYSKANHELKNIDAWMAANKLSININKTAHKLVQQSLCRTVKQNKPIILTY